MTVKQSVLALLEQHCGEYLSGEAMAQTLGVSRAAVWKAVAALRGQGYGILGATNRGYSLDANSDLLSAEGIRPQLAGAACSCPVVVFDTIDSTNLEAKRRAASGAAHGSVFLAESQTLGRGRFGRSFVSPPGCGIYMSLLLRPAALPTFDPTLLTTATAVAVCRAIEARTDCRPQIKWVNDLYLDDKKICGILTEAVTDFESGQIETIIIGLGLNVRRCPQAIPPELQTVVGALFDENAPGVSRNRLAAQIVNELFELLPTLQARAFLQHYRARSLLLGKQIVFTQQQQLQTATALDIDDDGGLLVRLDDGRALTLRSGEVSVRPAHLASTLPDAAGGRAPAPQAAPPPSSGSHRE